jgi:DNA-binding transcriptional regulator GbsR (MarR family)
MVDFKQKFIQRTGQITKQWGLGEPVGKIWGLLLFENRALSQREIAEQINYSLSLVSPNLTLMETLGLVSIVGKNGRETQYGAVPSFIVTFEKIVKNFIDKEVQPLVNLLDSNIASIKDNDTKKRFENMLVEYRNAGEAIKMLSKFIGKANGGNQNGKD